MSVAAIQGIEGSYSEAAARVLLSDPDVLECVDFASVFAALAAGRAEFAVLPVENKIAGFIAEPVRMIEALSCYVEKEVLLNIEHVLAAAQDAEYEQIVTVRSHPAALKQCSRFFKENNRFTPAAEGDTASCIRDIITANDRTAAAICSRRAAEIYGAKVMREGIADDRNNWTRFQLISIS